MTTITFIVKKIFKTTHQIKSLDTEIEINDILKTIELKLSSMSSI